MPDAITILGVLGVAFVVLAIRAWMRERRLQPRAKAWLIVGLTFSIVAASLAQSSSPAQRAWFGHVQSPDALQTALAKPRSAPIDRFHPRAE